MGCENSRDCYEYKIAFTEDSCQEIDDVEELRKLLSNSLALSNYPPL